MSKWRFLIVGSLLILCLAVIACSEVMKNRESNSQRSRLAEYREKKSYVQRIPRNEDGISIYCPKEFSDFNPSAHLCIAEYKNYYSSVCGRHKKITVLLPPHFVNNKKYPVLYVLHGYWGDENSLVGDGNIGNLITLSNMIDKGVAEEMIVVFPNIYSSKTKKNATSIDRPEDQAAYDNFCNELITDIIPWVKSAYPVLDGAENTAVTGFSIGGREALTLGIQYPDVFGYVQAIAPVAGLTEARMTFKKPVEPRLIMICSGDCDDIALNFPAAYHSIFLKNKVKHIWWIVPGSDHGEPAISSGIFNFAERLFK